MAKTKKLKSKRLQRIKKAVDKHVKAVNGGNILNRRAANNRHKLVKQLCAQWMRENEPKVYVNIGAKAAEIFPKARG